MPIDKKGWIKVDRSIEDRGWYKKSEYVHLYVHLLMKAAHSEREDWISGQSVRLKPGQLVTGRKRLSSETGINQHKVYRILETLKTEQRIEQRGFRQGSIITVLYNDDIIKVEQQSEQHVSNKRATNEQHVSTIQELENLKIKESTTTKAAEENFSNEKQKATASDYEEIDQALNAAVDKAKGKGNEILNRLNTFGAQAAADELWREQAMMSLRIDGYKLVSQLRRFVRHCITHQHHHNDSRKFRRHFCSWQAIQNNKAGLR